MASPRSGHGRRELADDCALLLVRSLKNMSHSRPSHTSQPPRDLRVRDTSPRAGYMRMRVPLGSNRGSAVRVAGRRWPRISTSKPARSAIMAVGTKPSATDLAAKCA